MDLWRFAALKETLRRRFLSAHFPSFTYMCVCIRVGIYSSLKLRTIPDNVSFVFKRAECPVCALSYFSAATFCKLPPRQFSALCGVITECNPRDSDNGEKVALKKHNLVCVCVITSTQKCDCVNLNSIAFWLNSPGDLSELDQIPFDKSTDYLHECINLNIIGQSEGQMFYTGFIYVSDSRSVENGSRRVASAAASQVLADDIVLLASQVRVTWNRGNDSDSNVGDKSCSADSSCFKALSAICCYQVRVIKPVRSLTFDSVDRSYAVAVKHSRVARGDKSDDKFTVRCYAPFVVWQISYLGWFWSINDNRRDFSSPSFSACYREREPFDKFIDRVVFTLNKFSTRIIYVPFRVAESCGTTLVTRFQIIIRSLNLLILNLLSKDLIDFV